MNTTQTAKTILRLQLKIDILKAKQKYLGKISAINLINNKVWLKNDR